MRIYYVIEIKRRELQSRILFALYGANEGHSVVIGSKQDILSKIKIMEQGYYFFKSIQHGTLKIIKHLKSLGFRCISLDEEGLMHYNDEYYLRRLNGDALKEIYKFFNWGEKDKKLISNTFPDSSKKLIIAGNSRINLLNEKFSFLLDSEIQDLKKKFGKFFLISTKFGKINFVKRKGYKEYVHGQVKSGYVKTKTALETAKLAKKHEQDNFKKYLTLIKYFGENFKSENLLILPHPGENRGVYEELSKNYENIYVVGPDEFSTNALLKSCEANISCNCTTAVETFFLKNLSINYMPYHDDKVEYSLPKLVSKNLYDFNDLIHYLKSISNHKKKDYENIANNNAKEISYNISNNFFPRTVILELDEFECRHKDLKTGKFYRIYFTIKRKIKEIFYSLFFLDDKAELKKQKIPSLSLFEIKNISKKIQKKLNFSQGIDIDEIYPGVFKFKKTYKN